MTYELLIVLVVFSVTAAYFVISRRRKIPKLDFDLDRLPEMGRALPLIAGLTGSGVSEGNRARLHQNGSLLDALVDEIGRARESVHFETYVWNKGEVEARFVDILCRKAEEGVMVRVLLDAVGAIQESRKRIAQLRASGVQVAHYHPVSRASLRRYNSRTHRKLLIVDGAVGYVFGHGIMDAWAGNAQDQHHWRDTGLSLRGPIVCSLQSIFAQDWIETAQAPPLEDSCFPESKAEGPTACHFVSSSTRGGYSSVALLYMLAIASARREVIIQNPYFAPNPNVPELLEKMVQRGVSVHLMLPGKHTDSPILSRAGKALYGRMLRNGVRIYEYQRTLLHQKVMIIDGIWSHIGSTNFDARSLALNAEAGVGLLDEEISAELRQAFFDDLKDCRELTIEQWRQRAWYQALLDRSAYWFHSQI